MEVFLLSVVVFILVVLGMAIGVLFGRRGIRGSCGGSKTIEGLEGACPMCGGSCEEKRQTEVTHQRYVKNGKRCK